MRTASLFVVTALLLFACKKKDDQAPLVERFLIDGQNEQVISSAGTTLNVEMSFLDNEELDQYRLKVESQFTKTFTPFELVQVGYLSGKSASPEFDFASPDSLVAGPYLASLEVIDADGNRSEEATIPMLLLNDNDQAVIDVTSPNLIGTYSISKGDTLFLEGTVIDNVDLDLVCVVLDTLYNEVFDLSAFIQSTWQFAQLGLQNKWLIIPANAVNGEYQLLLRAEDSDAHITVHTSTIAVVD